MKTPSNLRSIACFTLIELLVSMAILTLLLVMMASIVNQTSSMWSSTRGKIEQFREARDGFEAMTRRISQATLNTYWDYEDADHKTRTPANSATFTPSRYARQSELRFISGPGGTLITSGANPHPSHSLFFQAPIGMVADTAGQYAGLQYLLNTWGYYIEYGSDISTRPSFVTLPGRNRFRLMELIQPSEQMTLYTYTSGSATYRGNDWYMDAIKADAVIESDPNALRLVHVLAENIIALVLLPKLSPEEDSTGIALSPDYLYDSTATSGSAAINPKNQLPPVVQVTMVAIDEASAGRMKSQDNAELKGKVDALFGRAADFKVDLRRNPEVSVASDPSLEAFLIQKKISYRIFTTNVSIKGAKWSRAQIN